jgi:hypothetical protein
MASRALTRLRKLCLALPEAREVIAWGAPTFRVKTIFAMYAESGNNHSDGRESVWVKALPTNQELMLAAAPERFFYPPYTGPSGWIGVYLDSPSTDWDELGELLRDAWEMSAPPKLVAIHGGDPVPAKKEKVKTASKRRTSAKRRTGKSS